MIHRIFNLVGVGRVSLVDDAKATQRVQVDQGKIEGGARRITDDVPFIGLFGFSSNPPLKTDLVLARLGGSRSQTIAIASNDQRSRPKNLQPGDSIFYRAKADAADSHILLKDGVIEIDAAGGDVMIQNADTVTIKATTKVRLETDKLEVTGDIVSRADGTPVSLNGLRDAYHAHKHLGVTGSPGTTDSDA